MPFPLKYSLIMALWVVVLLVPYDFICVCDTMYPDVDRIHTCSITFRLPSTSTGTERVLKTEACFMTLCHFGSCTDIQKIIMYECFKGMIVIMAHVKRPVITAPVWTEVCCTPVHSQAVKAEKKSTGVWT